MKHDVNQKRIKYVIPIILIVVLVIIICNRNPKTKEVTKEDETYSFKGTYDVGGILVSDITLATTRNDNSSDNKLIIHAIVTNVTEEMIPMHMMQCIVTEKNGNKIKLNAFVGDMEPGDIKPIDIYTNYDIQNVKGIIFE